MKISDLKHSYWRNPSPFSYFLFLVSFFFVFQCPLSAQEFSAEDEWKHWQSFYNQQQAQAETDPAKKQEWLQKPLAIKEIRVDAENPRDPKKSVSRHKGYETEKCATCHDGIEAISESHPANYGCTVCHGGNPESVIKAEAHSSLLSFANNRKNPSDLRINSDSCGLAFCHSGNDQDDLNHILRVKKSIMATNAGEISALRYLWAAQPQRPALYGSFGITDEDGYVPSHRGGLSHLQTVPFFSEKDEMVPGVGHSGRIADSRWRKSCDNCHLWGEGPLKAGSYRASGCAACHVPYAENGLYQGADPTIPRDKPGHMAYHRISSIVPDRQCLACHMEMKPSGKFRDTVPEPDIHLQKGMTCMDCHTQSDVMGDTNIYSKGMEQVEIRCETCHGDIDAYPFISEIRDTRDRVLRLSQSNPFLNNQIGDRMVVSVRGNKLTNVKVVNGDMVLVGKKDGKARKIPMLKDKPGAHAFPGHLGKLECGSCHSRWSVEIDHGEGIYDQREHARDKLSGHGTVTRGSWKAETPLVRAIEPSLVIGPRGKVTTALLRKGFFLTALDSVGKPVVVLNDKKLPVGYYKGWTFPEPRGFSTGSILESKAIHSIGRESKSCRDCHSNPSALALGKGDFTFAKETSGEKDKTRLLPDMEKSGSSLNYPDNVKGTVKGEQVSGDHQPGTRAFSRDEINRILKVGLCTGCHDRYLDPIYRDMKASYIQFNEESHRGKIKGMLSSP